MRLGPLSLIGRGFAALVRSCAIVAAVLLSQSCAREAEEWRAELTDEDPYVRGMAAIALCEGTPDRATESFPVLFELLDSPEIGLQDAARRTLARTGVHNIGALLGLVTRESNLTAGARSAVVDALAAAGPAAIPSITAALHEPGRSNARALVGILVRIGDPAIDPLIELLERDSDRGVRAAAAWGLGRIGPRARRALPALEHAAEGQEVAVSRTALQSLPQVDVGGSRALPVLRRMLASPHELVREASGDALTRFHLGARHTGASQRSAAADEILRLGNAALRPLVEALDAPDADTARMAEQVLLAEIARFELVRALESDGDSQSRLARVDATILRGQTIVQAEPLESLHNAAIARGLTALALARAGKFSTAHLPLLADALSDPRKSARWCAALAIFLIAIDASGALSAWRLA